MSKGLEVAKATARSGLVMLSMCEISAGKNAREDFVQAEIEELAQSILDYGLIEPIVVRPDCDGYEIIAGERRWRAAKIAGLTEIPAVVRDCDDTQAAVIGLVENLCRADLNPVEEARGYQRLVELGMKQTEISAKLSKSQSAISNAIRLLKLPASTLKYVREGRLTGSHAEALVSYVEYPELLAEMTSYAMGGVSAREVETIPRGIMSSMVNRKFARMAPGYCGVCSKKRRIAGGLALCFDLGCLNGAGSKKNGTNRTDATDGTERPDGSKSTASAPEYPAPGSVWVRRNSPREEACCVRGYTADWVTYEVLTDKLAPGRVGRDYRLEPRYWNTDWERLQEYLKAKSDQVEAVRGEEIRTTPEASEERVSAVGEAAAGQTLSDLALQEGKSIAQANPEPGEAELVCQYLIRPEAFEDAAFMLASSYQNDSMEIPDDLTTRREMVNNTAVWIVGEEGLADFPLVTRAWIVERAAESMRSREAADGTDRTDVTDGIERPAPAIGSLWELKDDDDNVACEVISRKAGIELHYVQYKYFNGAGRFGTGTCDVKEWHRHWVGLQVTKEEYLKAKADHAEAVRGEGDTDGPDAAPSPILNQVQDSPPEKGEESGPMVRRKTDHSDVRRVLTGVGSVMIDLVDGENKLLTMTKADFAKNWEPFDTPSATSKPTLVQL